MEDEENTGEGEVMDIVKLLSEPEAQRKTILYQSYIYMFFKGLGSSEL